MNLVEKNHQISMTCNNSILNSNSFESHLEFNTVADKFNNVTVVRGDEMLLQCLLQR